MSAGKVVPPFSGIDLGMSSLSSNFAWNEATSSSDVWVPKGSAQLFFFGVGTTPGAEESDPVGGLK